MKSHSMKKLALIRLWFGVNHAFVLRPGQMLCATILFCGIATPANAYIDPGTGSMLVQGIVGGVAFVAFMVRLYWHKIKAFLRTRGKTEQPGEKKDRRQSTVNK